MSDFYITDDGQLDFSALNKPAPRPIIPAVDLATYIQDRVAEAWHNHTTSPASRAFLRQRAVIWRTP
jgi:hypothetical protein